MGARSKIALLKKTKKADEDGKWKRISSTMEQEGVKWSHEACKRQWRVLAPADFADVGQEPTPSPKSEDYDNFIYEDEQKPTPSVLKTYQL